MTRRSLCHGLGLGAALALLAGGAAPLLSDPASPPASVLPMWPKNVAAPILGTKVRVNATTGIRRADGFPVPVAMSGMPDGAALAGPGLDGLEFSAGTHSLTVILPAPQIVEKVAFLNLTAEGTFTASLSGSDPQVLAQGGQPVPAPAPGALTAFSHPATVHAALFQPQTALFVQIEFRLSKPGKLARLAVYGPAADTDYALKLPNAGDASPGTKRIDLDVAALATGARVTALTSARPGADPASLTADALGSAWLFPDADPAPAFDIDLQGPRRADRAVLLLSGPPSRVEIVKIARPAPPPGGPGVVTVTRSEGDVESVNLDGTGLKALHIGDVLPEGKALNVGFRGVAELDVDGTSFLRVGTSTNLVVRRGKDGKGESLSLLRGSILWQVYGPGGGGELATPALAASVTGGVVAAEVALGGESRVGLLAGTPETAGGPGPVALRDPVNGAYFRPRPGEGATLAPLGGEGKSELALRPFSVATWWQESRIGAPAGGLHGGAEKGDFATPLPPPAGEVLGSTTTEGGIATVQATFPEQTLEAVRFRITPLASGGGPVAVVKALVLGLYAPQEARLDYQPAPAARVPAPSSAPASAAPAPSSAPASPAAPLPSADALTPTPVRPAPPSAGYTPEESGLLDNPVYQRQNSKGAPHFVPRP